MKKNLNYFTKFELILWISSIIFIISSFIIFDRTNYFNLCVSLIGATSLIFCSKGNPIGQCLIILFSLMYGVVSLTFRYYGEMITYVFMTLPMAVISLISWIKNPVEKGKLEVKVNTIKPKEILFMLLLSLIVTIIFYLLLSALSTPNLLMSTISISTSFIASYLTFRRSEFYALAYAANDVALIILWVLASIQDISYLSIIICFIVFLVNDIYGYINWLNMKKRQKKGSVESDGVLNFSIKK